MSEHPASEDRLLRPDPPRLLDGQIQTIRSVISLDRLGHLGPAADAQAVHEKFKQTRQGVLGSFRIRLAGPQGGRPGVGGLNPERPCASHCRVPGQFRATRDRYPSGLAGTSFRVPGTATAHDHECARTPHHRRGGRARHR